ncbi:hypothetical protein HO173_003204 [Letharia columbiana]|uniref:Uncharacterized protein n=1 Tax=Letharia columbiana TaxID=112416 RepID=A0A8H6G1B4_9LECA|nr:uncharacterized protein HO173_013391 [Letharia columbiana]XP_037167997.1 uncharacterized protein HO173_003204 [Letharia columbiana]KAF6222511.1 hypothetical protein HO173_013391 [Letharia columbiana]KAF6238698.1 hypothetical protein HO173_003204 [Letharia columbiana]
MASPYIGPQGHVDSRLQAETDEAILEGIVSGDSSQPSPQAFQQHSQQAPIKVLTRPASSGKDPAAGFSFTKAKPVQQFDFRRPKQTPVNLTETRSHQSPPLSDTSRAVQNAVNTEAHRVFSCKHDYTSVPFPNSPPTITTLTSDHSLAETVKVVHQLSFIKQNRSAKTSKDPLTSVAGAPKVVKSRQRKTTTGLATVGPPSPKETYIEGDIIKLLMYHRWQGQQELEYFRTTEHQMEAEIQQLRDMINYLSGQLHEVVQRETWKTAKFLRLKANKPIWESKIKQLNDYVKGVTNDHKRLGEDADDLHKKHEDVFLARNELHYTLEDSQKSAEQERIRSQQLGDEARHRIENLAQTVQHQSTQLRGDESLLMAERERSNRLEDQISRITASHGRLLEIFTSHRDTITSKIDDLLHQAQSIVPPNKNSESESHGQVGPMLEQCFTILQKLHNADTVKPEDLRKLNDNMDSFVEGIARSVEACEESSNSMEAGQKQLALAVQDQLRALSGNIISEHALSEQISDLREVRATVREQLQATESSLADARREVIALRLKDQEQSRRIVTLETVAARGHSQPTEASQALLHIQELDPRNRTLQSEIVSLRKEAADLSSQLQQSSTDARESTERLATSQEQLETACKETTKVREKMLTSESQAMAKRDRLRRKLSKAANMQIANMQSEHMNAIQQLRLEKSPAQEKLKNVTRQVNMLKAEKEKSEKETAQLQVLLKEAQSEKEAVIGTRKALQLHLKEIIVRNTEKNYEYSGLQAMLNRANDQVKAKNLDIMALQATLATRPSSSRMVGQSPSVRGTQPAHRIHTQHRDSQHASIDQSSSVRPATPKSSMQILEDSQPPESSPFVSLDELHQYDPFAGYAREESQTIAGEDISHLFPSTPGADSRAQDHDYSRNSVFHKTVLSETQRRQQRSFRETTPHTGSRTTDESYSQSQARIHSKAGHNYAMPRSSTATSTTQVTAHGYDTKNPSSHREVSITRDSTKPQGSVKDPRQGKLSTVAADFNDTNSQVRPSKVQEAGPKQAKALGPIIEDSQSPFLNGRSRKMTRRKSSAPKGVARSKASGLC